MCTKAGTGMAFMIFSVMNAALGILLVVPTCTRFRQKNASGVTLLALIVALHLLLFDVLMLFLRASDGKIRCDQRMPPMQCNFEASAFDIRL